MLNICTLFTLLCFPQAGLGKAEGPLRRIAFGSCAHQDKPQPIWDAIVAAKPELFLFLGDTVYGDTTDMKVLRAKYAKLASLPAYQHLMKTCPLMATWDDHDMGVNDGGKDYPKKVQSQEIFLDFLGVSADSPRRSREGVYDAAILGPVGKQVQIILLDTRYARTALKKKPNTPKGQSAYEPATEPDAAVMAPAQWKWFEEQLRKPAQVRLIGSSIQLAAEDHGFEKWMNFPRERERFLQLLKDTSANGVVILSGDRHLAEISVMDAGLGYPLFDITSSGLNQGTLRWRALEINRHRLGTMHVGNNFGMALIDWDKTDPIIRLQIRDEEGEVTLQQRIPLSLLQPRKLAKENVGPRSPAEAIKHVDEVFTVEFVVGSTGKARNGGLVFLNSSADYRDEDNFTVVLETKGLEAAVKKAGIEDLAKHFDGKKIRATGKVAMRMGKPQIVITEWEKVGFASDSEAKDPQKPDAIRPARP